MSKRITEFSDEVISEEDEGFWQVSDVMPKEIVQEFTKDCGQENCRISVKCLMTKMGGVSHWYDKQGQLQVRDYNSMECVVCCIECEKNKKAKSWVKHDK